MQEGFIFNSDLCVACNACRAACILENGWGVSPREIFSVNREAAPGQTVINLSLACNHCEKPLCLQGCPTRAYYRDNVTGAVLHDEEKCIGCNYCRWNCPYDAPKPKPGEGIIQKCNLCIDRLRDGLSPACSSGCPTGALSYGTIKGHDLKYPECIPDKNLRPGLTVTGLLHDNIPETVPDGIYSSRMKPLRNSEKSMTGEWSLIIFSFLVILTVSLISASVTKAEFPPEILISCLIIFSGAVSLFHLGRPRKALKALFNLKSSQLSREILLFIIFSGMTGAALISESAPVLLVSAVMGLLLLVIIDSVYIFAEGSARLILHSGQAFLTGLMLTSVFSAAIIPLIFISAIKLVISLSRILHERKDSISFRIRFLRIGLLVISLSAIIAGVTPLNFVMTGFIIAGEILDRIIYYYDFNPLNINTLVNRYPNRDPNEK